MVLDMNSAVQIFLDMDTRGLYENYICRYFFC